MENKFTEAISTPLASIFGSGFLVIIPVLAKATGPWLILAMTVVSIFAFCVGSIIRYNIIHAERVLRNKSKKVPCLSRKLPISQ